MLVWFSCVLGVYQLHSCVFTHQPTSHQPNTLSTKTIPNQAKEAALPSLEEACGTRAQEKEKAEAAVEAILESVKGAFVGLFGGLMDVC